MDPDAAADASDDTAAAAAAPPVRMASAGLPGSTPLPPPSLADLPTLDAILAELESGAFDPTAPDIFSRLDDNAADLDRIDAIVDEVAAARVASYADDFEEETKPEVLTVGAISIDDVKQEERRIREDHVRYQKEEAAFFAERQEKLAQLEDRAKRAVLKEFQRRRTELRKVEKMSLIRARLQRDTLQKAFIQAEGRLLDSLSRRKGEVTSMYGDLTIADGQYAGNKDRRWRVDWDRAPQPVQIKVDSLRGLKDKVPGGKYLLLASLYDRLGGHLMRWSRKKGHEWNGATLPAEHGGRFTDLEFAIDQSLFCALPPKKEVLPGMILVFELYLLRNERETSDRVMGWSAFPICDPEFNIVAGKFKCPMMRGLMDTRITEHHELTDKVAEDLDSWLCNVYFEIVRTPRYVDGQVEFEVELQHTSGLLGYPGRDEAQPQEEEHADGGNSLGDAAAAVSRQLSRRSSIRNAALAGAAGAASTSSLARAGAASTSSLAPMAGEKPKRGLARSGSSMARSVRRRNVKQGMARQQSAAISEAPEDGDGDGDGGDGGGRAGAAEVLDADEQVTAGLSYVMHADRVDDYYKRTFAMLPFVPAKKPPAPTREEKLGMHTPCVVPEFRTEVQKPEKQRMAFVTRQIIAELGVRQMKTRQFWFFFACVLLTFWIRMWVHYLGQWIYLFAAGIPTEGFELEPFDVKMVYQENLLFTEEIVLLTLIGTLANFVFVGVMVLGALGWQQVMGYTSEAFSLFIAAWSLNAMLDPISCLICSVAYGRYVIVPNETVGDAFKLWYHFEAQGESGLPGIFLTIFLYFVLIFTGFVLFYVYYLRLHLNGRLLDVYRRITAEKEDLYIFTPLDHEVSNFELYTLVAKAEKWRGATGERRKVAVYDYVWEEAEGTEAAEAAHRAELKAARKGRKLKKEITTHVSIHTIHLDGYREVHRQFLRMPDGAIVEVFGELTGAGLAHLDIAVQKRFKEQGVDMDTLAEERDQFLGKQFSVDGGGSKRGSIVSNREGGVTAETI